MNANLYWHSLFNDLIIISFATKLYFGGKIIHRSNQKPYFSHVFILFIAFLCVGLLALVCYRAFLRLRNWVTSVCPGIKWKRLGKLSARPFWVNKPLFLRQWSCEFSTGFSLFPRQWTPMSICQMSSYGTRNVSVSLLSFSGYFLLSLYVNRYYVVRKSLSVLWNFAYAIPDGRISQKKIRCLNVLEFSRFTKKNAKLFFDLFGRNKLSQITEGEMNVSLDGVFIAYTWEQNVLNGI